MTKRSYSFLFLIVLFLGVGMQANAIDRKTLAQYAASLKGKKGASLKAALQPLLKPKKVLGYGSGSGKTWDGFYETDRDPKTNECYNRYSSEKFTFGQRGSSISGMNIEHSFPKSWWGSAKNDAYKDLYHLYPSPSKGNSQKSNYAMDEVTNATIEEEGYDKVGTGKNVNTKAWEPGDRYKGDFARTYMYMAVAYGNLTFSGTGLQTMNNEAYPGLKPWASALYRKWSKADKVDDLERTRNNTVATIEGNRNLFIDYPYLAEYVWGDSVDVAFDPSTSISTATDDPRYLNATDPYQPEEPITPDDVYYFSTTNSITSGNLYLIVADNGGTLYAMNALGSSQNYGYPKATSVKEVNDTITLTSTDNAFTIEESGSGYTITDANDRYLWHDGTFKNISVSSNATNAEVWTITPNGDGTFKILTDGTYFIQYSKGHTSYGCYSGQQSDGIMPKLYIQVEKNPTGIKSIQTVRPVVNGNVYTIQGQFVGKNLDNLPRGLYIRNGKKIIVR